jgi:predicted component of type VI protein secretion system
MDDTLLESVIRDAIERWTQLYNKGVVAELSGAEVKSIARRAQLADAIRAVIRAAEPRRTPN